MFSFPRAKLFFAPLLFLMLTACGAENVSDFDSSVNTESLPLIQRVNPATGRAGDTVTILGSGFSSEPALNIINVGTATTTATAYALVDPSANGEIESLTFTVPPGASVGAGMVFVTVLEWTSNSNVSFTVNP